MSQYRDKRNRGKKRQANQPKPDEKPDLTTSMVWAGKNARINTLTGSGDFDPSVPIDQSGDEGDDALIWADVPTALTKRLEQKPQQITEECLRVNAVGILSLYENDIVQHVIKQKLLSDHMASLLRRQGAYVQSKRTGGEMKVTANKLVKSSFLGIRGATHTRQPVGDK